MQKCLEVLSFAARVDGQGQGLRGRRCQKDPLHHQTGPMRYVAEPSQHPAHPNDFTSHTASSTATEFSFSSGCLRTDNSCKSFKGPWEQQALPAAHLITQFHVCKRFAPPRFAWYSASSQVGVACFLFLMRSHRESARHFDVMTHLSLEFWFRWTCKQWQ